MKLNDYLIQELNEACEPEYKKLIKNLVKELDQLESDSRELKNIVGCPFTREDIDSQITDDEWKRVKTYYQEKEDFISDINESICANFDANEGLNWNVINFHKDELISKHER